MAQTYFDDLNAILLEWGNNVANRIKTNLDSTGTTASGRTRDSITVEVADGELTIYGRPYFQGVEEGRGAGKVPYNFTDILYKWMQDKGIAAEFGSTEAKQRSAAFVIGKFIEQHGTKLYRDGGREDIYTNVFEEELPKLEEKIGYVIRQSILHK